MVVIYRRLQDAHMPQDNVKNDLYLLINEQLLEVLKEHQASPSLREIVAHKNL